MDKNKKLKVLLLFSGGLDSILAVKVLEEQGIEVTALTFVSYFFDEENAKNSAEANDIKLRVENVSDEHFKVVKIPKYGYGRAMNPCIDCHLFMIKKAAEIMQSDGYDFVATGEVLGQRPMSQNKQALEKIARQSGIEDRLLRPLSAKLLEPIELEKEGEIDRDKLLDISGRGRGKQLELAEKYKVKIFPSPGGGCKLTEKEYGNKLRELLGNVKDIKSSDINLLSFGRHFWTENNAKIIIGRDKGDNQQIEKLAKKGDILLELKDFTGPLVLIRRSKIDELDIEEAKKLAAKYSRHTKGKDYINFEYKIRNVLQSR